MWLVWLTNWIYLSSINLILNSHTQVVATVLESTNLELQSGTKFRKPLPHMLSSLVSRRISFQTCFKHTEGGFWTLVPTDSDDNEMWSSFFSYFLSPSFPGDTEALVYMDICINVRTRMRVGTHIYYVKFWDLGTVFFPGKYYSIRELNTKGFWNTFIWVYICFCFLYFVGDRYLNYLILYILINLKTQSMGDFLRMLPKLMLDYRTWRDSNVWKKIKTSWKKIISKKGSGFASEPVHFQGLAYFKCYINSCI